MNTTNQQHIQLHSPLLKNAQPLHMTWSEYLSQPYRIELELSSKQPLTIQSILYHPLSGLAQCQLQQRPFHGIVTRITRHRRGLTQSHYQLVIEPAISLLGLNRQYKVFQQQSELDIITSLLKQHSIPFVLNIDTPPPKKEQVTQYNESDLDFMHRMLFQCGLHYTFIHQSQQHQLRLSSQAQINHHLQLPLTEKIKEHQTQVLKCQQSNRLACDQHTANHIVFTSPTQPNTRTVKSKIQPSPHQTEHYHYGQHAPQQVKQFASSSQPITTMGSSNALLLEPGTQLDIQHRERTQITVTEIHHHINDTQYVSGNQENPKTPYQNDFMGIPLKQKTFYRPYQEPCLSGIQTATVEAAHTDVDSDGYAQIHIRFPWAHQQVYHARYCSRQASDRFGHQFIPRHQQQVVVQFIDGDPNQGVVIGALYNGQHHNSFATPYGQPINGIRSQLALQQQQQGHELSFDDSPSKELLRLHSAGTLEHCINHNATITTQNNVQQIIAQGNKIINVNNGSLTLNAKKIHLQCGESIIEVSKQAITFKGVKLSLSSPHASSSNQGLARVGDSHQCGKYEDLILPHNGGDILKGSPDVMINNQPAARVGDPMHCDHSQDSISEGADHILINDKPAARKQDKSEHGGHITKGSDNVNA